MRKAESIEITSLKLDEEYIFINENYEETGGAEQSCLIGTGKEILDHVRKLEDYDGWEVEMLEAGKKPTMSRFLRLVKDGSDYYHFFKLKN